MKVQGEVGGVVAWITDEGNQARDFQCKQNGPIVAILNFHGQRELCSMHTFKSEKDRLFLESNETGDCKGNPMLIYYWKKK